MIINEFEKIVRKYGKNMVIKNANIEITYDELNIRANNIARRIREIDENLTGVNETQNVSLLFEHSESMLYGIIGTLKAKKTYIPLDTTIPIDRINYMVENSGSYLILTNTKNVSLSKKIKSKYKKKNVILNIDDIECISCENPSRNGSEDKIAYIMYTSGSTGKPKGVYQSHSNILYFIENYTKEFSISSNDRLTLFSSFSHDASIPDIFGTLLNGATLYIYDVKANINSFNISGLLADEKISIWHSVPTFFRCFVNTLSGFHVLTQNQNFPHLRWIILGGEKVIENDIKMYRKYFKYSKFANLYGMTESTINSIWTISPGDNLKKITTGKPIDGAKLLVVDDDGDMINDFKIGEIVVANKHCALGYWNDLEKTKDVFTEDFEFGPLYWTGDFGRITANNEIEFIGRKDSQVKIRGYRIEMGEIESELLSIEEILEAAVLAKKDKSGEKYLCAYVVKKENQKPDNGVTLLEETFSLQGKDIGKQDMKKSLNFTEVKKKLSQSLPEYMVPSYFVQLERMPLTANGKVDVNSLHEMEVSRPELEIEYVAPRTRTEKIVTDTWLDVLELNKLGVKDNIFDAGGNSFNIIKANNILREKFRKDIPIGLMFNYSTIESFSKYLDQEINKKSFSNIEEKNAKY